MKSYRARVEVRLKRGLSDPEGETTRKALADLKYRVGKVTTAKVYEIELQASSLMDAKRQVEGMCRRLLANLAKDDFVFKVEEAHDKVRRRDIPR